MFNETSVEIDAPIEKGKGFVKLMFTLFGWMMRKSSCDAQAQELASLKALAERG